jgi:hypothetical protein
MGRTACTEPHCLYRVHFNFFLGQAKDDSLIRRMRIPCRIPRSKNTLTEYVILIFSLLQQWMHEHASVLRYMCIASLVKFENTLVRAHTGQ